MEESLLDKIIYYNGLFVEVFLIEDYVNKNRVNRIYIIYDIVDILDNFSF